LCVILALTTFLFSAYYSLSMTWRELTVIARETIEFLRTCARVCFFISIGIRNLFRLISKKDPIVIATPEPAPVKKDIVEYKPEVKKKKVVQQTSLILDADQFQLPDADLLTDPAKARRTKVEITQKSLERNAKLLKNVLDDFGVQGDIVKV